MLNNWVFLALLGALAASLGTIFAKIGLHDVPSHIVTTIRGIVMAFVVALFTFFVAKNVTIQSLSTLPASAWIFITLSAICGAVSWLLFFQALSFGPAQGVTVVDKLSIIFTLILAALFLGESFTWKTAFGGFSILLGTLLIVLPSTAWSAFSKLIGIGK